MLTWRRGSQLIASAANIDPRWTHLETSFQIEERAWRYEADAIGMKAPSENKNQSMEQRTRRDDFISSQLSDQVQAAWQDINTMCAIANAN